MEKIILKIFDDVKFYELDTAFMWVMQYRRKGYVGLVGFASPAANIQGSVKENMFSATVTVERYKK